jgi:hypothetical protein
MSVVFVLFAFVDIVVDVVIVGGVVVDIGLYW